MTNSSNLSVVNHYLTAFYSGDFDRARTLVSEDFAFKGPFIEAASRDAFFTSAASLTRIVRGHRLLRQWQDGDDICSIFEMNLEAPTKTGSLPVCEWHACRQGIVVSARLLFDTAAFRQFVPAR